MRSEETKKIVQIKREFTKELFAKYKNKPYELGSIVRIAVAKKKVKNKKTEEKCIRVVVLKKLPESELKKEDIIPKTYKGVKTDVEEGQPDKPISKKKCESCGDRPAPKSEPMATTEQRPVPGGVSGTHYDRTACTISIGLWGSTTGRAYFMSNMHCFYPYYDGAEQWDFAIQPSPNDGGDRSNVIGTIQEYVELSEDENNPGKVDGSIARTSSDLIKEKNIYYLGDIDGWKNSTNLELDDPVEKHGRTSGYTSGTIDELDGTSTLSYTNGPTAYFDEQIRIDPDEEYDDFAEGGDSGSLTTTKGEVDKEVVGLLYARDMLGRGTLNPMERVMGGEGGTSGFSEALQLDRPNNSVSQKVKDLTYAIEASVETLPANEITEISATIWGKVTSLGGNYKCWLDFYYRKVGGTTWTHIEGDSVNPGDLPYEGLEELSGLDSATEYEFYASLYGAEEDGEIATGSVLEFTTEPAEEEHITKGLNYQIYQEPISGETNFATPNSYKQPQATGDANWENPTNAYAEDGNFSSTTGFDNGNETDPATCWYDFLYGGSSLKDLLPEDIVIKGIEVEAKAKMTGGESSLVLRLTKNQGDSFAGGHRSVTLDSTNKVYQLGGENDLWGTDWQRNDFDINFGVIIIPSALNGYEYFVDVIRVKVYYASVQKKTITKSLTYDLYEVTQKAIQKGLEYRIRPSIKIENSLKYVVKSPKSLTKELYYEIDIPGRIIKLMQYAVEATKKEEKELSYNIFLGSPNIEKPLEYAMVPSTALEKNLTYRLTTQQIEIYINGELKNEYVVWDSLDVTLNKGSRVNTCSFTYEKFGSRDYVPAGGDEVLVYDRGERIFGGHITKPRRRLRGKTLVFDISCKGWIDQLDRKLVKETFTDEKIEDVATSIINSYATNFNTDEVKCNIEIDGIYFDNETLSRCLDRLAEIAGEYHWYIDPYKNVYFYKEGDFDASFDVEEGNAVMESINIEDDYEQIKNRIKVKGPGIPEQTVEDGDSIEEHGEYETKIEENSITSVEQAIELGEGVLKREAKPKPKCRYLTQKVGLMPGTKQRVKDTSLEIDQEFTIERVKFRTKTPNDFEYNADLRLYKDPDLVDFIRKETAEPMPEVVEEFGNRNFTATIKFIPIDGETLEWESGKIIMSSGETYDIISGELSSIVSSKICYFNPGVSETELQFSTTFGDGVGGDRVALGYVFPGEGGDGCQFVPISFMGGIRFSGGEHILARTIVGEQLSVSEAVITDSIQIGDTTIDENHIKIDAITAEKINVTNLSAISADIGHITTGTLEAVDIYGAFLKVGEEEEWLEISDTEKAIKFGYDDIYATRLRTHYETHDPGEYPPDAGFRIETGMHDDKAWAGLMMNVGYHGFGSSLNLTLQGEVDEHKYGRGIQFTDNGMLLWSQGEGDGVHNWRLANDIGQHWVFYRQKYDSVSGLTTWENRFGMFTVSDWAENTGEDYSDYFEFGMDNVKTKVKINDIIEYDNNLYFERDGNLTLALGENISIFDTSVEPQSNNDVNLGHSNYRWKYIYLVNDPDVSSSIAMKEDIRESEYGLDDIMKVNPIMYKRKGEADDRIGIIAEELEKIFPEISDGKSYKPTMLTSVLVKAVQELNRRLEKLEKE